MDTATFAAGCFWGVEETFLNTPGVIDTEVGYTGGTTEHATYPEVCTGTTGHAEAVNVTYDPDKISYDKLLDVFWNLHDPTQHNRQGPDVGSQYRSAIFFHNQKQQLAAEASKDKLQGSGRYADAIATQIVPAAPFWRAEEYHQKYVRKNGGAACHI